MWAGFMLETKIVLLCLWSCCSLPVILGYSTEWQRGPDILGKQVRGNFAMATVDKSIYLFGGLGGTTCDKMLDSVLSLNTSTDKWSQVSQMPDLRYNLAAATYKDEIVVVGGCDIENDPVNTTEFFYPNTSRWKNGTCMPTQRCSLSAVVVGDELYAIGGFRTDFVTSTLRSVDVYSFKTQKWHSAAPMVKARWGHRAVAYNGLIYVVGGCDGETVIQQIEMYDPAKDVWSLLTSLSTPRYDFGIAVAEANIFIIGGTADFHLTPLNDVEIYDVENNEIVHGDSLTAARFSLSAAAVEKVVYAIGGVATVASSAMVKSSHLMMQTLCQYTVEEYVVT